MANPTFKKLNISIGFSTTDGYISRSDFGWERGASPQDVLKDAVDELARISMLYGERETFETAANAAFERVEEFLKANPQYA